MSNDEGKGKAPKIERTIIGIPVSLNATTNVPQQTGMTLPLGIPVPAGVQRQRAGSQPQIEVLHVEDRLSLDDRWSLEAPPPAPAPAVATKPETPASPARVKRESRPRGPASAKRTSERSTKRETSARSSSPRKTLFVLVLIGAVTFIAYLERDVIAGYVASLMK